MQKYFFNIIFKLLVIILKPVILKSVFEHNFKNLNFELIYYYYNE